MSKTPQVPHIHAALIVQWAAGAAIECRLDDDDRWDLATAPTWKTFHQYRVKPEPVTVYPTTKLSGRDLEQFWLLTASDDASSLIELANYVLQHAVDNDQIIIKEPM